MKEKLLVLAMVFYVWLLTPVAVQAGEEGLNPEALALNQLETLNLQDVEQFIRELDKEVGEYLPDLSIPKVLDDIRHGRFSFGFGDLLGGLGRYLFRELLTSSSLLGKIVILAVFCAVLKNLLAAFERGTTGKLAYGVTYLVLITLALSSFTVAVNTAKGAIDQMVSFVQSLLPVLLTLMVAAGGPTSAALVHPFVMGSLGLLSTLIRNLVFPLIYFSVILIMVNQITERFQVSRLSDLFKQASMILLGLFLTIFVGALSLYGVAGAVADGVAMRTAKYLTGAFIPVVGKMLSDAVEAVVGSSLLATNAIHIVAMVGLFAMAAFPAVKIIALVVVYKVAGALVQPFGDSQMSTALDAMGGALTMVFAAVAAVGLMFFIALSAIVGMGNMTVMLR
ncbi:stage III sporulation protein AE [Clostridiales bacterium PH28_bin88]|nr:stage III sporulation protein AE [Clostridiales bacterium PH28_bin88]